MEKISWTDHVRNEEVLLSYTLIAGWTVRGANPGGDEIFCTCPDRLWTASCTMGTGSFPGVKRPGRDADTSPPFSAEV
jgi:hypothetical protein